MCYLGWWDLRRSSKHAKRIMVTYAVYYRRDGVLHQNQGISLPYFSWTPFNICNASVWQCVYLVCIINTYVNLEWDKEEFYFSWRDVYVFCENRRLLSRKNKRMINFIYFSTSLNRCRQLICPESGILSHSFHRWTLDPSCAVIADGCLVLVYLKM